jgi:hypothetical protein
MKCCGNCSVCELEVNKQACCAIQTLRNIVEVKGLLVEVRSLLSAKNIDTFASIPNIDTEPTALGAVKEQ